MMDRVLILVILSPFVFPAGVLSGAASAEALDSITYSSAQLTLGKTGRTILNTQ